MVGEGAEGLGAVVPAAQRGEVGGVGLAGWSAVVEGDVLGDVVEVGPVGGAGAAGEHARAVAQPDRCRHRGGRVVDVDRRTGAYH